MAATAEILQIGRRQCYALAAENRLPGLLRIGARPTLRVSRAVLMNWINADGHGEAGGAPEIEEETPSCP